MSNKRMLAVQSQLNQLITNDFRADAIRTGAFCTDAIRTDVFRADAFRTGASVLTLPCQYFRTDTSVLVLSVLMLPY